MSYGEIRIIAGRLRGRKIKVVDAPFLRPTPDRVRERIFNWLSPHLHHARCMDLFCGTGILGIEALSRGAKHLTSIDASKEAISQLYLTKDQLKLGDAICIIQAPLPDALSTLTEPADVVFIDTPYQSNLGAPTLQALIQRQLLCQNALIYIESNSALSPDAMLPYYEPIKSGQAGQVFHQLLLFKGYEHA